LPALADNPIILRNIVDMSLISATTKAALEELLETALRPAPADWLGIRFRGQMIGYIQPDYIASIKSYIESTETPALALFGEHLHLESLAPYLLSQELQDLAEFLKKQGFTPGWRDESFSWLDDHGHERFRMERAAFRSLGFHSRACHINGYTAHQEMYLGMRSANKATDPNMLDNLAAGGISADETLQQCVIRELWEEASVPTEMSRLAEPVGHIHVRRVVEPKGLHDESLYTYDLLLSDDFSPKNNDGEVSGFIKVPYAQAADLILEGALTPDAAAVAADFLLRKS
jgi:8-oxo-dGTP pyrophosphatase MutT (NUDIX family)